MNYTVHDLSSVLPQSWQWKVWTISRRTETSSVLIKPTRQNIGRRMTSRQSLVREMFGALFHLILRHLYPLIRPQMVSLRNCLKRKRRRNILVNKWLIVSLLNFTFISGKKAFPSLEHWQGHRVFLINLDWVRLDGYSQHIIYVLKLFYCRITFYLIWGRKGSKDLIKYSNIGNQEMSAKKLSSSPVVEWASCAVII